MINNGKGRKSGKCFCDNGCVGGKDTTWIRTRIKSIMTIIKRLLKIETLRIALSKIFTPPNLREAILDRVYNYYDSNLRDAGRVAFDESNSYDSRSGSEASIASRRGQRRIIEPEDDQNTEDENSTSNRSEESILMNPRRKMISRMEANSMESDEVCLEFASNG